MLVIEHNCNHVETQMIGTAELHSEISDVKLVVKYAFSESNFIILFVI
jgi:hypothetical protein